MNNHPEDETPRSAGDERSAEAEGVLVRAKCSPEGWCSAMASRLDAEANAHRKGLSEVLVYNMRTDTERVIGVAFKRSSHDRGLMLNVCPWCRAEILWSKADTDPAVANGAGKA